MNLHHIAIWTYRLEELKDFYVRYFQGKSSKKYINSKKRFESYFISFGKDRNLKMGAALEIMSRTDIQNVPIEENRLGLTHFAFSFQNKREIIDFTERLRFDGYIIAGEPRITGDGYFESVVLDPDGNRIECVYKEEGKGDEIPIVFQTEHLCTSRLLLRPFEENDLKAFFECCRVPELGINAGWKPHETLEESRSILHTVFMGQENIWAILLKGKEQLIGSIGLVPDPKRDNLQARMLGYWLDKNYWGKGYMSEAVQAVLKYGFEKLALTLITACCYPHNLRSQSVLQKSGFIYEGTLYQAEQTYDGYLYDHHCYYLMKK